MKIIYTSLLTLLLSMGCSAETDTGKIRVAQDDDLYKIRKHEITLDKIPSDVLMGASPKYK